jgi:hypothetical protein
VTTPNRSIHILQMDKHFLYLPIYFAERHEFFGFLPAGTKVVIDSCDKHTDIATYDQMMDEAPRYRDFAMAITDPIQVFRTPLQSKKKPAVLATLVTNAAFWAVNHGTHPISGFRDLGAFDRVIAYGPGTTSHNIAKRIARDSGNASQSIEVVDPGNELLLLTDKVKGANAVALSPDLLYIEEMVSNGASIELALGKTPEYNDVLVTALVSTKEFVAENQAVVQGIMNGIQRALLMTRRKDSEVLGFARDYFYFADRAEGAVNKAVESDVFPLSVKIAQSHWTNAAKAYHEANRHGASWSKADEKNALDYYQVCVQPYEGIAEYATENVLAAPQAEPTRSPKWAEVLSYALPALVTIGITALMGWRRALVFVLGLFGAWAVLWRISRSGFLKWATAILAVAGVVLVVLPFVPKLGLEKKSEFLMAIGISFFVTAVIEYGKHRK